MTPKLRLLSWILDSSAILYFHLAICYITQNISELSDCSFFLPNSSTPKDNHINKKTKQITLLLLHSSQVSPPHPPIAYKRSIARSENFESLETFLFLSQST